MTSSVHHSAKDRCGARLDRRAKSAAAKLAKARQKVINVVSTEFHLSM